MVIILSVTLIYTSYSLYNYKDEVINLTNIQEYLGDSVTFYKNKEGKYIAELKTLQISTSKYFKDIQSKDSTILHLQKLNKTYKNKLSGGGSIASFETLSTLETTLKTHKDTAGNISTTFNTEGLSVDIRIVESALHLKLNIKNSFSVIIGSTKVSLFKREPFATVISNNSYTGITKFQAVEFKDTRKKKRFSVGVGASIDFKGNITPSASIHYSIWKF